MIYRALTLSKRRRHSDDFEHFIRDNKDVESENKDVDKDVHKMHCLATC